MVDVLVLFESIHSNLLRFGALVQLSVTEWNKTTMPSGLTRITPVQRTNKFHPSLLQHKFYHMRKDVFMVTFKAKLLPTVDW